jgi:hypothetical protein
VVGFGVCVWFAGVSGGDYDLQQGICCERGVFCKQIGDVGRGLLKSEGAQLDLSSLR